MRKMIINLWIKYWWYFLKMHFLVFRDISPVRWCSTSKWGPSLSPNWDPSTVWVPVWFFYMWQWLAMNMCSLFSCRKQSFISYVRFWLGEESPRIRQWNSETILDELSVEAAGSPKSFPGVSAPAWLQGLHKVPPTCITRLGAPAGTLWSEIGEKWWTMWYS
jgi:hypothetical protein